MKVYGYATAGEDLLELLEVTIQSDPGTLRELAQFLNRCADAMEVHGDAWDHEHFRDRSFGNRSEVGPDLIVARLNVE